LRAAVARRRELRFQQHLARLVSFKRFRAVPCRDRDDQFGVRYLPRTDGQRNPMFERVFLTLSPVFEEVLPKVPNPVGLHAREAVDRVWQMTWGPPDYVQHLRRLHSGKRDLGSRGRAAAARRQLALGRYGFLGEDAA
jgi:hypothetical protein